MSRTWVLSTAGREPVGEVHNDSQGDDRQDRYPASDDHDVPHRPVPEEGWHEDCDERQHSAESVAGI